MTFIADENNVTKRSDVLRKLTNVEVDQNFQELKNNIIDVKSLKPYMDSLIVNAQTSIDQASISATQVSSDAQAAEQSAAQAAIYAQDAQAAVSGALQPINNLSDLTNKTTARTNLGLGTAATQADTKYNFRSNNLLDVPNKPLARTNLGLGTSATQPDTKYTFRSNNLSDLTNPTTARTNLGLGTSATQPDTKYTFRSNNLLDVPNKATARNNLGLGSSATTNIGKAVGQVPIYENVGGVPTINTPANGLRMGGQQLGPFVTGTWTPTLISDSSNQPTVTYAVRSGLFTRQGDLVFAKFVIVLSSYFGGNGNVLVSGFPYPMWGTGTDNYSFFAGIFSVSNVETPLGFSSWAGETHDNKFRLSYINKNGMTQYINYIQPFFKNNSQIQVCITYITQ